MKNEIIIQAQDIQSQIALMKSRDSMEIAYPLTQDPALTRFVHAWSFAKVEISQDCVLQKSDMIKSIWSSCDWDVYEIGRLINKSAVVVMQLFTKARDYRLIYPDGSISDSARQFLMIETGSIIAKKKSEILKKG